MYSVPPSVTSLTKIQVGEAVRVDKVYDRRPSAVKGRHKCKNIQGDLKVYT